MTFTSLLVVALGGAAGSVLRYLLKLALDKPDAFPWPTFIANVLGSFALGIFAVAFKDRPTLLLALGVGVCGGLTTFSTFAFEIVSMMQQGKTVMAMLYAVTSLAAGFAGVWLGMKTVSNL